MSQKEEPGGSNFDHVADEYDDRSQHLRLNTDVSNLVIQDGVNASQIIFEFGCGTGNLCLKFCKHVKHVYGVDISDKMLARAKAKINQMGIPNATLQKLDFNDLKQLEEISFPTAYDIVLVGMVLHHLPDPMAKLNLFKKMLKPKGRIVIVEFGEKKDSDGHSHEHGHGHAHNQGDHSRGKQKEPARDQESQSHPHNHQHQHSHKHSHSHGNDGAVGVDPLQKEKYGIFVDGFSPSTLTTALEKLSFQKVNVNYDLRFSVEDEDHPFHGFPIIVVTAVL